MLEVDKCRHFTGMLNEGCEAGVLYADVMGPFGKGDGAATGQCRIPCLPCGSHLPCAAREYPSAEEAAESEKRSNIEVAAFMEKIVAFDKRQTEDCPHCGVQVTLLQKVGRCVYARPCNCRLWQGVIPLAWRI